MNGMELIENVITYIRNGAMCMILNGYLGSNAVTDKSNGFK